MRINTFFVLISGIGAMMGAPTLRAQLHPDLPVAKLHLTILDPFGKVRHDQMSIHLISRDGTQDFMPDWSGLAIVGVPYGTYTLNVQARSGSARRELAVNCEELWVRVGVPIVIGDHLWPSGGISIEGTIDPAPKTKHWWARIEGVYLGDRREVPITTNGRFTISEIEPGLYLLEVFEDGTLRHVQMMTLELFRPEVKVKISVSHDEPRPPSDEK